MIAKLKTKIASNLRNVPGWRTNRKIVVFESDDWGAIRMPSKETYSKLLTKGLNVNQSPYNKYDALESNDDLSALFEILMKYKGKNGKHPVFTALSIVANPDFKKIKENNFSKYEFESVVKTFNDYGASHNKAYQLWKEGIEAKIFYPEFHGREHINAKRWLKAIKNEESVSRTTFNHNFYGLGPEESNEKRRNHFPAFDLDTLDDVEEHKNIITEGLELFNEVVGYKAQFFIPPNFYYSNQLEAFLEKKGIRYLAGSRRHLEPIGNDAFKNSIRYTGLKNKTNQLYLVRNVQFEHSQTNNNDDWQKSLNDIRTAFFWKKPAIISTHRLNYIGYIDEENRKKGLQQLDQLLKNIVKKWPDVEFMTSVELGEIIKES